MASQYTKTVIWQMNISELRAALVEHGLDSTGLKTALQNRLREAIFQDDSGQSQSNTTGVNNVQNNLNVTSNTNSVENEQIELKILNRPVFRRISMASRLQACIA